MKRIRVCIIGCGNISNTRHIPAVNASKKIEIVGLISNQKKNVDRTINKYKSLRHVNSFVIEEEDDVKHQLEKTEWFKNVDAVIIGTPPKQHYNMVIACLSLKKHVLVEKPMMMRPEECMDAIKLANKQGLILNVMHSFQFSNGMLKLKKRYGTGEFGKLKSIFEVQLSNRDRRLPVWYNELPLGLFYDEASHFFYSAREFGGELNVMNAEAVFNNDDNTPRFIQVQMMSGEIPVQMYMNFNSPICEWGIMLVCEKKLAIYDYFKDILVVLNNDNQHLAKDVLINSMSFFWQFWSGFCVNGVKMLLGRLLYGHDICVQKFVDAIIDGKTCDELSPDKGREVVEQMNEVISKVYGK